MTPEAIILDLLRQPGVVLNMEVDVAALAVRGGLRDDVVAETFRKLQRQGHIGKNLKLKGAPKAPAARRPRRTDWLFDPGEFKGSKRSSAE